MSARIAFLVVIAIIVFAVGSALRPHSGEDDTEIRIAVASPIGSSFILASPWPVDRVLSAAVHQALVAYSPEGRLMPQLAEAVPSLSNGGIRFAPSGSASRMIVRYILREGLRWSDGEPITAADASFSVKLQRDFPFADDPALSAIEDLATPDARTLLVTFRPGFASPGHYRPFVLPVYPHRHLAALSADAIRNGDFPLHPVGAGPYVITSWRYFGEPRARATLGVRSVVAEDIAPAVQVLELERNPYFVGQRPWAKRVRISAIPRQTGLLAAVTAHQFDLVIGDPISRFSIDEARANVTSAFTVGKSPSLRYDRLDFNLRRGPLTDVRVRRALALGIDRSQVALAAVGDEGGVMTSWIPPSSGRAVDVLARYPTDRARAAELVRSAGFANGPCPGEGCRTLDLQLLVASGDLARVAAARAIRDQLQTLGVEVEIRVAPPDALLGADGALIRGAFDLALYQWQVTPEPQVREMWSSGSIPGAENGWSGDNLTGWSDIDNDALIGKIESGVAEEQVARWYGEQQQRFADALPSLPLYERADLIIVSARLRGIRGGASVPLTWNIASWYVLTPT